MSENKLALTNDQLTAKMQNIHTLYLKTKLKAEAFVNAIIKTGSACKDFKKELQDTGTLGDDTLRDFIDNNDSVLGFKYSQFAKYIQIANASTKAIEAVSDDTTGYYLTLNGEKVPATIDNLQKCIAKPASGNKKDDDGKTPLERLFENLESIKDKFTENQKKTLEENKEIAVKSKTAIDELQAKLDAEKDLFRDAREALKDLKDRTTSMIKIKTKEEEAKKKKLDKIEADKKELAKKEAELV